MSIARKSVLSMLFPPPPDLRMHTYLIYLTFPFNPKALMLNGDRKDLIWMLKSQQKSRNVFSILVGCGGRRSRMCRMFAMFVDVDGCGCWT